MMIKRIFASSIVVLLLSVSPLAAACDLSCAFPSTNTDCHSQQASQDSAFEPMKMHGMKMDDMSMDAMAMPEMAQSEDHPAVSLTSQKSMRHFSIGDMGPCERQVCDNSSVVSARISRSVDSHLHFARSVVEAVCPSEALTVFPGAREGVASHHALDASPLHVSLRI
jgi:hypothetical protein